MLSLGDAIKSGRLQEFIAQAEASDLGPVSEAEFDRTASTLIKTPLSDDQTSGSSQTDGSPEK
jgi:hypothetical protein